MSEHWNYTDGTYDHKITRVNLPFMEYTKDVAINNTTGEKRIDRHYNADLSPEKIGITLAVVTGSGIAVNQICNGLAHLIYACKKKNKPSKPKKDNQ